MSKSNEVPNEVSRRDVLVHIGKAIVLTTAGAGILPGALAQELHLHIAALSLNTNGKYQPKYLNDREYKTLRVLSEQIVPGALDAGAPEFIDFLCSRNDELAAIYTGGLAWMDDEMRRRGELSFVDAPPARQTALLDVIAYRKNETPATAPGVRFFVWARNMVLDAYYTSPAGIEDLGYMGNSAMSSFSVPQEAVGYAIRRSPFASES
jgi:gluconate 2-dehydrogenase gamma chain